MENSIQVHVTKSHSRTNQDGGIFDTLFGDGRGLRLSSAWHEMTENRADLLYKWVLQPRSNRLKANFLTLSLLIQRSFSVSFIKHAQTPVHEVSECRYAQMNQSKSTSNGVSKPSSSLALGWHKIIYLKRLHIPSIDVVIQSYYS